MPTSHDKFPINIQRLYYQHCILFGILLSDSAPIQPMARVSEPSPPPPHLIHAFGGDGRVDARFSRSLALREEGRQFDTEYTQCDL